MLSKLEEGDRVVWPGTEDAGTVRVDDGRAVVRWDHGDDVDEDVVELATGLLPAFMLPGRVVVERIGGQR